MENYKVLIVEDEEKTGEILQKALKDKEIDSDIASDGQRGVEYFQNNKYDLVILDLKLPELTGDEVLKKIREMDPYIEVVVYTNYDEPPIMAKLINLHTTGFYKKGADSDLWEFVDFIRAKLMPLSPEETKEILNRILN
ncbi:MAG: response regulator [Leptospiraceae bacterium]|nr:response regulator [Leptospiraceae bacterium]MCP5501882.1 response regulator [Leptospiraceae bacterium]